MFLDVPQLSAGWRTAGNGYEYKITSEKKSWEGSRAECQSEGGELAAVGMRDINIRR